MKSWKMSYTAIVKLMLWALVAVSGYYAVVSFSAAKAKRVFFEDELHAVPCEFKLDATHENHIQVPFHHTYDGLHGCVLCIRTEDGQAIPELPDASFMEVSLLDGDSKLAEGDSNKPCKDIWVDGPRAFTMRPLAQLWLGSPHIPHKDYVLDVVVTKPRSEASCAELPIVACYNPCGCMLLGALIAQVIGFVLCLVSLGLALGIVVWTLRKGA